METMNESGCLAGNPTEDEMKQLAKSERTAIYMSNVANLVLFVAKVYASYESRSLAVIASTLDSLLDLLSGFILWFTSHAMKKPNLYHYPIGKKRMQPVIELYNSMVEKEGTDGEEDAMKAYRAAHEESDQASDVTVHNEISSALIDRVDAMLQNLEKEIDDVDAKIGDRWRLLDRDYDGKVTPEEVASAAMYLKDTLGKEGVQELISNLSKDRDGKILVEDIVKLGSRAEDAGEGESEAEAGGK